MYHPLQNEYTFHNEYGTLVVEAVTGVLNVRNVRGEDFSDDIKFSLGTAEQITLITENRHTQIAFQSWTADGLGYLMVHTSASTVVVVRIKSLEYAGPNATEEIERLNRLTPAVLI